MYPPWKCSCAARCIAISATGGQPRLVRTWAFSLHNLPKPFTGITLHSGVGVGVPARGVGLPERGVGVGVVLRPVVGVSVGVCVVFAVGVAEGSTVGVPVGSCVGGTGVSVWVGSVVGVVISGNGVPPAGVEVGSAVCVAVLLGTDVLVAVEVRVAVGEYGCAE